MTSRHGARPAPIGYLVNAFPVVSETFLVSELRALEQQGVELAVIALSRRRDGVEHRAVGRLVSPCHRPPKLVPLGWLRFLGAHVSCALRAPGVYLRMLRDDVARPLLACVSHRRLERLRSRPRTERVSIRRRARLFALAPWIAWQARRAGVVHLHAHYAKDPLEVAARVRWLAGIPYSFAAHAKDLYTTPASRLARRLAKARFAVTCHRHGERTLRGIARPADAAKVLCVPHGIDGEIFGPATGPPEPGLILAVGRLTPKKGFETLIEACSLLKRRGRDFRLVLIGEGRLRRPLEKAVSAADLGSRVELRPFVRQEELAAWYQRAAMVALPARVTEEGNRDGVPNVLLEALACGTPVVTTAVGGIGEIVRPGENGLLTPPDDPAALAGALELLLDDPELRDRLAEGAAPSVAGRCYRRLAQPLAASFRRIARKAGGGPGVAVPIRHRPEMIAAATRRFGRRPRLEESAEAAIARAIGGGLKANAWRPDLERLVDRRLWDEVYKTRWLRRLRRLLRRHGSPGGEAPRVLDLGCGRGGLSVAMRAAGMRPVAADLRLKNCRMTRLRGQRYDLGIPAGVGRAERLPFADRSFDVVCMLEVLEHVGDPAALLAEARRVCRPEGLCVVTVVNRWAHFDPHYRMWGVNFLPRRLAPIWIALRGRSKSSGGDNQRLDDMHYFSFRRFRRLAHSFRFEVRDPEVPGSALPAALHRLGRAVSLGFNTATVILVPR